MKKEWKDITVGEFELLTNSDELTALKIISGKDNPTIKDYNEALESMKFLNTLPTEITIDKVLLDGKYYIPSINPELITAAQFIDLLQTKGDNMSKFLSCVFIPEGYEYNTGYSISKVEQLIKDNMTMDIAYGFFLFYLILSEKLLNNTQPFLKEKRKAMKKLKKIEKNYMQSLTNSTPELI